MPKNIETKQSLSELKLIVQLAEEIEQAWPQESRIKLLEQLREKCQLSSHELVVKHKRILDQLNLDIRDFMSFLVPLERRLGKSTKDSSFEIENLDRVAATEKIELEIIEDPP